MEPHLSQPNGISHGRVAAEKAGLIVTRGEGAALPSLRITDAGRGALPDYHAPERFWDKKWNQIWYMLIFDVPESERHYRDTLRGFLKRMRMGCLQKSVWVTPRDIRPEYDDLQQAANVHAVSFLLESRTVLHRETQEIVENAWNLHKLGELHDRYIAVYEENLALLQAARHDKAALINLLRQEAEAYIQCMRDDPLLPADLLPRQYQGKDVFALHEKIRHSIADQLTGV